MLQGFIIAFSMYSKIPMPNIRPNKKNQSYAIAFFPFVGLLISAFIGIWLYFAPIFHFSRFFISCIALLLPFLITGNIHFHGFLHTIDALASHQEKEKKLELLETSYLNSSICSNAIIYFLFSFAVWNELSPFFAADTENDMIIICLIMLIYIISRCLAGLSILTFPPAKTANTAKIENIEKTTKAAKVAKKTATVTALTNAQSKSGKVILLLILFICCLIGFFLQPLLSPLLFASSVMFFFVFRFIAKKHFGGISDELMGWFVHSCELLLFTVLLLGCKFYY